MKTIIATALLALATSATADTYMKSEHFICSTYPVARQFVGMVAAQDSRGVDNMLNTGQCAPNKQLPVSILSKVHDGEYDADFLELRLYLDDGSTLDVWTLNADGVIFNQ